MRDALTKGICQDTREGINFFLEHEKVVQSLRNEIASKNITIQQFQTQLQSISTSLTEQETKWAQDTETLR